MHIPCKITDLCKKIILTDSYASILRILSKYCFVMQYYMAYNIVLYAYYTAYNIVCQHVFRIFLPIQLLDDR